MMRKLVVVLFAVALSLATGCEKEIPSPPPFTGDPVPELIKALDAQAPMGRLFAVKRLGELGPSAKAALPALKDFAKKHPELKKEAETTIGKIEGRIPMEKKE